jgi:homoserine acetyltransferase
VVGGVDSDRLYPIAQQQLMADCLPGAVGGLRTVRSRTATTASCSS